MQPRKIVWLVLVLFGLLPICGLGGEFDNANQFYDEGKFAEAKQGYERLVESGGGSANVFYDLGNAEFRLDSTGRAILNYERALALNPHHPEAQANLKLLRERSGAKLLPLSRSRRIAINLAPQAWSVMAAVSGWLVLFGVVFLCTNRRGGNFAVGALSLLSAVVCAAALVAIWSVAKDQTLGIITAPQTEARLAPAESAGVAELLPAGSQVRVLSERGAWVYCEMPNASRGWVSNEAVERVRPDKS